MILLQVRQVARVFGADTLFENIDLAIQEKSRIALVGRNGIGKSTLLKIIIGQNPPDQGKIIKNKNLTIGYLAQNTGLESENTIYAEMLQVFTPLRQMETKIHRIEDQIATEAAKKKSADYQHLLNTYDQLLHDFKAQNGYGYQAEIRAVLHGFKFFEKDYQQKISSLSGGQKTRLALAKLLLEKRDLLILDEPTNHLDIDTLSWLENYLQNYRGALLIVSHDRYFMDKTVNEVYELTPQKTIHYTGNYTKYVQQKQQRLLLEQKAYEKQQEKIGQLEDFVQRNIVRASTTKRAQSRRKQLEKIDRLQRPQKQQRGPRFSFAIDHESGNIVLKVNNVCVGYNQKVIAGPINFELRKKQILAIVGQNGVGKSTFLKTLLNQIPVIAGEYHFGAQVDPGYYDQELKNLHDKKTVLNEVWDDHPTLPEKDIRSVLGSFLFSGDDVMKSVYQLSGGERARLLLTKLALNHHNFLIFDEPTNHLDIESKEVLEEALLNFSGTVLFISHDRYFINKVATKVLEITSHASQLFLGNYDYYVDKKEEQRLLAEQKQQQIALAPKKSVIIAANDYQKSKESQKAKRKLQREIAALEAQLDKLEKQDTQIQQQMTQPQNYTDQKKSKNLQDQLNQIQQQQKQVEAVWEDKSLKLESLE
jgi:ATP-binding cassette subfamily F protein 3